MGENVTLMQLIQSNFLILCYIVTVIMVIAYIKHEASNNEVNICTGNPHEIKAPVSSCLKTEFLNS